MADSLPDKELSGVDEELSGSDKELSPDEEKPSKDESQVEPDYVPGGTLVGRGLARSITAFLSSLLIHLLVVIGLALVMMPSVLQTDLATLMVRAPDELAEELETVVLDEQTEAATEMIFGAPSGQAGFEASDAMDFNDVELDQTLMEEDIAAATVDIDSLLTAIASSGSLLNEVPVGTPGRIRSVVDGYRQAMDRITQEIMLLLYKGPVLVIWCFDESKSMKDDQKQVRNRIERVYAELGLSDRAEGDALMTTITSYGENFHVHTKEPTSNLDLIRKAISAVPEDRSGKEMMCQAVGRAINMYKRYATKGRRRMIMILVTDESGELENNAQYIEAAIAEAKSARCKVYVLGREACFGYPYVYFRYQHPQTKRPHWIRVNRGPETAFVEQIQTNGFRRRYDAFPSGFGPWEQSRLCYETGGIFFLLPSLEGNLVRGEKRRYQLDAMRWYRPDLRARMEILSDRDGSQLRTVLWKIICDLNPYNKQTTKVVELREHFSIKPDEFTKQVSQEQKKAKLHLAYLDKAIKEVEKIEHLRQREDSRRWQGNYDLLHGQLFAYIARLNEYGVYLDECLKNPKKASLTKEPNLFLIYWDLRCRKKQLTAKVTEPYVKRGNEILGKLIKEHRDTPWAARAQWELNRGYGVELIPYYEPEYLDVENAAPLPRL